MTLAAPFRIPSVSHIQQEHVLKPAIHALFLQVLFPTSLAGTNRIHFYHFEESSNDPESSKTSLPKSRSSPIDSRAAPRRPVPGSADFETRAVPTDEKEITLTFDRPLKSLNDDDLIQYSDN